MEECQGRETIQDTTVVGPKVDKYRSLLSLDSIQTQVRGTFLEISTGNIADFAFLEGAFDGAPFRSNNQHTQTRGCRWCHFSGISEQRGKYRALQECRWDSFSNWETLPLCGGQRKVHLSTPWSLIMICKKTFLIFLWRRQWQRGWFGHRRGTYSKSAYQQLTTIGKKRVDYHIYYSFQGKSINYTNTKPGSVPVWRRKLFEI